MSHKCRYIECAFNEGGRGYTYKTYDSSIKAGDKVLVKVKDELKIIDVVKTDIRFNEQDCKFQIKAGMAKVDLSFYEYAEAVENPSSLADDNLPYPGEEQDPLEDEGELP